MHCWTTLTSHHTFHPHRFLSTHSTPSLLYITLVLSWHLFAAVIKSHSLIIIPTAPCNPHHFPSSDASAPPTEPAAEPCMSRWWTLLINYIISVWHELWSQVTRLQRLANLFDANDSQEITGHWLFTLSAMATQRICSGWPVWLDSSYFVCWIRILDNLRLYIFIQLKCVFIFKIKQM